MESYDAIVVGVGGVGAATLAELADRGWRVLGLDRHGPPHVWGSSHGQTRIIRQAYFEHPNYVPLLRRAYELWKELETWAGEQLFFPVGLLQVGPAEGEVLSGVRASVREHGLAVDWLSSADIARDFPLLPRFEGMAGVLERQAGYLLVERCVAAHLRLARERGAEFRQVPVLGWRRVGEALEVMTTDGPVACAQLVVAGGAWSSQLLAQLNLPLQVLLKHLHWYPATAPGLQASAGCPTFLYDLPHGCFYGFPAIDELGVKLAEHSGGQEVEELDCVVRDIDAEDQARVTAFAELFSGLVSNPVRHATCFYTMSPDKHFILDRHPELPQVKFAAGLSGHGYKFAAVLGEVLADWVTGGVSPLPVGFLGLDRLRK